MFLSGKGIIERLHIQKFGIMDVVKKGAIPHDDLGNQTVMKDIWNKMILHLGLLEDRKKVLEIDLEANPEIQGIMEELVNEEHAHLLGVLKQMSDHGIGAFELPKDRKLARAIIDQLIEAFYREDDIKAIEGLKTSNNGQEPEDELDPQERRKYGQLPSRRKPCWKARSTL